MYFPNMQSKKAFNVFREKYYEIFNLNILCDEEKQIKRHVVITESAKAIELILNHYIALIDKNSVIEKYESVVQNKCDIDVFFNAIIQIFHLLPILI